MGLAAFIAHFDGEATSALGGGGANGGKGFSGARERRAILGLISRGRARTGLRPGAGLARCQCAASPRARGRVGAANPARRTPVAARSASAPERGAARPRPAPGRGLCPNVLHAAARGALCAPHAGGTQHGPGLRASPSRPGLGQWSHLITTAVWVGARSLAGGGGGRVPPHLPGDQPSGLSVSRG